MPSKTRKLKNRVRKSVKKNTRKSVKKNTRNTFKRKSLKKSTRKFLKKNTRKYLKIQKGGWNMDELGKVVGAYLLFYEINFGLHPSDIENIKRIITLFLNEISYEPQLYNYLTDENEGVRVYNEERLELCRLYMTVKIILEFNSFTSDIEPPLAMNLPMEENHKHILKALINSDTTPMDIEWDGNTIQINPPPREFNEAYLSLVTLIIKSSHDPRLSELKSELVKLYKKAGSNIEKRLSKQACAGSEVDLHCDEGSISEDD